MPHLNTTNKKAIRKEQKSNSNQFLLFWDNLGLESIIEINHIEQQKNDFFNILSDKQPVNHQAELNKLVSMMLLRANANVHRNPEIYTIVTDVAISKEFLKNQFCSAPQFIVDLIREKGTKILSYRTTTAPVII